MGRFKDRAKRWFRKIRNARRQASKKEMLALINSFVPSPQNWVEVGETARRDYPLYVPTHLRGTAKP